MAFVHYLDRYRTEYKFRSKDIAILFVETIMSKDNNDHELDNSLENNVVYHI
jgi:hypothetical protein